MTVHIHSMLVYVDSGEFLFGKKSYSWRKEFAPRMGVFFTLRVAPFVVKLTANIKLHQSTNLLKPPKCDTANVTYFTAPMRGSRKFCQSGSNFDDVFFFAVDNEGISGASIGPPAKRHF